MWVAAKNVVGKKSKLKYLRLFSLFSESWSELRFEITYRVNQAPVQIVARMGTGATTCHPHHTRTHSGPPELEASLIECHVIF